MRNTSGLKRGGPGRKKGVPNRATVEIRDFAHSVLERPKYRAQIKRQADLGTLHPTVLTLLHHYAYGVPKMPFEVEGSAVSAPVFLMPPGTHIAIE